MSRQEIVSRVLGWADTAFEEVSVVADTLKGTVSLNGSFLIADDTQDDAGNKVLEFMSYVVDVTCGEGDYSYLIHDVAGYVAVLTPMADAGGDSVEYAVADILSIAIPADYITLIKQSYGDRCRLHNELDSLLGYDISGMKARKLRRYENNMQEVAERFAEADNYYRIVRGNYIACYKHLRDMSASLDNLLAE